MEINMLMKNAYGIKELKKLKLTESTVVYAQNGICKTSLSKALYNLSIGKGAEIEDRLTHKNFSCELSIDSSTYTQDSEKIDNLIVYSRDLYDNQEFDSEQGISRLVADQELINKINDKMKTLEEITDMIVNNLVEKGFKENKSKEFLEKNFGRLNSVDRLLSILESVKSSSISINFDNLSFKDLSSKPYEIINDPSFQDHAKKYTEIVTENLSKVFDENFNALNYDSVMSTISNTKFLNNYRKIVIGEKKFESYEALEKFISEELNEQGKKPEAIEQAKELKKLAGRSVGATELLEKITNNQEFIIQLSYGMKDLIIAKLKTKINEEDLINKIEILKKIDSEVKQVIEEAKSSRGDFEKGLDIFNIYFNPPFEVSIENKKMAALQMSAPQFVFRHKRNRDCPLKENEIKDILSSGEKTTLMIIHLMTKILLKNGATSFIVLDDVVESFDYAYRAGMMEYIMDLKQNGNLILLLTHNFEFFKNITSRMEFRKMVARSKCISENDFICDGTITISENRKINMEPKKFLEVNSENDLIAAIPFTRELIGFLNDDESSNDEINKLTSCLHWKEGTSEITLDELNHIMVKKLNKSTFLLENGEKKFIDYLENNISCNSADYQEMYDLKAKICLSIACRVLLEKKIIGTNWNLCGSKNQTRYLETFCKSRVSEHCIQLLKEVNLFTSEFAHINSFMYEPLVDISPMRLVKLLKEIKKLDNDEIWLQD